MAAEEIAATDDARRSLRSKCWDLAIHASGTAWIFERRARRLRRRLKILSFLGMVVPMAIGGIVLSFGTKPQILPGFLWVAGVLGVAQLIGSVWSQIARWEDSLAYALESVTANNRLSRRFESLGEHPPADLELEFRILDAENQARKDLDFRHDLTPKEKRAGLRAGLRQFQRACVSCKEVPTSMSPTSCAVCGNF